MNQLSHFLDNSNVYGSDDDEARELRTLRNGAMKVTPELEYYDLDLLPPDNDTEQDCALSKEVSGIDPPPFVKCFKAGKIDSFIHSFKK